MKTLVRCLLALAVLIVVAAPVYSAAPAKAAAPASPAAEAESNQVTQIWMCEMTEGTTEEQVDGIAREWLKAIRQMPGGEAAKVHVLWPVAVSNTGRIDFWFVVTSPSFTDWGKFWDAYTDESAAAKADDINQGKVQCPDSMLWEMHEVGAN